MRIIIAGAGIGGLTLAVALRRRNIDPIVFERASELGFVGAGLTVQPNAMRALASIEIADDVIREGEIARHSMIRASDGRILSELTLDRVEAKTGAPLVCIHRARLQSVLLRHAGHSVRLGKTVRGHRALEGSIEVELEDGSTERCDLLVGADGLRSAVRRQMRGDEPLRFSGQTSWRGVATTSFSTRSISESWGRGDRFGIVPIGFGEVYWFAVANAEAGSQASKDDLLARFGSWHDPIRELIEATPPDRIIQTDIHDRPPIQRWSDGRAVLLGDAAHPMTPNLGQGGCQAIEDAVVLATCIARDPERAIAAYEAARIARANKVVERARSFGIWSHTSGALTSRLRNAIMRATPRSLVERQMIALLTFDPSAV